MEQAILNLSKVVGNFVEEQKGINVQLAQRIDTVESTLNKRIDGLESNLNQKIDNLQYSITKINKLLEVQERGRFPSQQCQTLRESMRWGHPTIQEWMRLRL